MRLLSYRSGEFAYMKLGLKGIGFVVEFPSDWHEYRRGWVRISLGLISFAVSFPWSKTVPDHGQCSGPEYGFQFFSDLLWIYYGKEDGTPAGRKRFTFNMPWQWRHQWTRNDPLKQTFPYRYLLNNGETQKVNATISKGSACWHRWWPPFSRVSSYIDIEFDSEVGERSGSWKGGTLGCSYQMKKDETPFQCLRRMERERRL